MKSGLLRSSRYSPGNMGRDSLEALFVGREAAMTDVVDKIVASVEARKEKHYVLLVGPRGSGKTHFVALAAHRIRDRVEENKLAANLIIAWLNEEEWGVASYLDFLIRILRALATEASDLRVGIDKVAERFSSDPSDAEALAESLISKHVAARTLLLICENLVHLFEGLGEEGQQRWRAFIQQSGFWSILATTPALFAAVTLQDHPFYGFFTLRELKRIDFETARELLVRKALHDGKQELAEFLSTAVGRARIHAIHHLALGNPRAYVVLYDFLDKESLDDLIGPFMHMVDDLTPYYQDKMRQLAPAQRKIAEFLCKRATPVTVKDIASQCLMSHQTAAKQILELTSIGFVSKITNGREAYCELAEPLMRICIEVKDNRTEHFQLFVEFLRHWFSGSEIEHRVQALDRDGHIEALDGVHIREALRCSRLDPSNPFQKALEHEAHRCYEQHDYEGLAAIRAKMKSDGGKQTGLHTYLFALRKEGKLEEALQAGTDAAAALVDDHALMSFLAETCWERKRFQQALAWLDEALQFNPKSVRYRCLRTSVLGKLRRHEDVIAEARATLQLDPEHWHAYDGMLEALVSLGRIEEGRRVAEELISRAPEDPFALTYGSRYFSSQREYERSLDLLNKALSVDGTNLEARHGRGYVRLRMGQYQAAREDLDYVVSTRPKSVGAYCVLSDVLMALKEYEAAAKAAEHLLTLDSEHVHGYVVLGRALLELGQVQAGMNVFRELLKHNDVSALLSAAFTARIAKDLKLATELVARAAVLKPNDRRMWEERTLLHVEAGEFDMAWRAAKRAGSNSCFARIAEAEAARGHLLDAVRDLVKALGIVRRTNRKSFVEGVAAAIRESVRHAGPAELPEAFEWLRNFETQNGLSGVLGEILTRLLPKLIASLNGSREEWERAIGTLTLSIGAYKECRIPLAMLSSAVGYTFTGDPKHLLQLPLEQRQLLESALAVGKSKETRPERAE